MDKKVALVVGSLSTSCIGCVALVNYYYPYSPLNDTLVEIPKYISNLNNALGLFVMQGLPFLLLGVLLNAGLGLAKKFTFSKLLLNLGTLGIAALLYCSTLFLEGYN